MRFFKLLTFFLIIHHSGLYSQENVQLEGIVGDFQIEMNLSLSKVSQDSVIGKYRYQNKKSYLTIKGTVMGGCIHLTEYFKEEITGQFYLAKIDGELIGKWTNEHHGYDVELAVLSGSLDELFTKDTFDKKHKITNSKSGSYGNETYFVNDMWFTDEHPEIEIGFNGGFALVEELSPDSVRFKVEVICGPTYHFAFAEGIAHKKDTLYSYTNEDGCEITIQFNKNRVRFESNNSIECGFGARAYLFHDFVKIKDEFNFEDYQSLEEIKR